MAQWLKQSTAATLLVGQFVNYLNGYATDATLTAGTVDEIGVYKNDATSLTSIAGTTTFTHRAGGMYTLTLSETDTNTLGRLTVFVRDDSKVLAVQASYMVVPAVVYDSTVLGTDYLTVDTMQIEGVDATNTLDARVQATLEVNNLDHLCKVADSDSVVDNSIIAKLAAHDGDWSSFDMVTDSLEMIADSIGTGSANQVLVIPG